MAATYAPTLALSAQILGIAACFLTPPVGFTGPEGAAPAWDQRGSSSRPTRDGITAGLEEFVHFGERDSAAAVRAGDLDRVGAGFEFDEDVVSAFAWLYRGSNAVFFQYVAWRPNHNVVYLAGDRK